MTGFVIDTFYTFYIFIHFEVYLLHSYNGLEQNSVLYSLDVAEIPHKARWKKEGNTSKGNWVNHLSSSDLIFIEGLWQTPPYFPALEKKKTPSVSNQNLSGASVKRSKAIAVEFG